jgi:hypothetical protein
MTRLYIAIPCLNRKAIAEQCLPTVFASRYEGDEVNCYNDGSTEYDAAWLRELGADKAHDCVNMGVDAQREMHIRDFLARPEFTHLYLTDSDAPHDPHWRSRLLDLHTRTGCLVCGYHTQTHEDMANNVFERRSDFLLTRFAPGVSYLLSRQQVERLVPFLNPRWDFDWAIPAILGYKCTVSDVSCVDHIGAGGMHDRHQSGTVSPERGLNPTPWLVEKRREILANLMLREV